MLLKETSAFILVLIVDMVFSECYVGCKSCSGSTCTSCEPSYFLSNGFCSQCPPDCELCNNFDNCTLCKPNKFGFRCTSNCDDNCLSSECHVQTGDCAQCQPGLYGFQCIHNCSLCENERCDLRTCSSGCRAGYYVYKIGVDTICQICPKNCKHCTNGNTCNICNNGFHLFKFNDKVHCVSCFQETQCPDCVIQGCNQCQIHNASLVCADCPEGQIFNGKTCESNTSLCSKECSTNCDSNGICKGECNEGWTGETCSTQCNSKCLKCTKNNRNSCLQCKGNFHSTDCNFACNPACIVQSGSQTCAHASGYCLNGCNQTFWGGTCEQPCPGGCKDLACDRNNGTCTDGCNNGLNGDKCTQSITIEPLRTTTTITSDETITQQQIFVRRDDKARYLTIGYFSGFGSCAAIVVFVILFYIIRRRYLASITHKDNKPNNDIPTYYNTRTNFGAVNAESADVINNYESLSNNRIPDNVYNDLGTTLP
ncbi:multiple epidermal growth factor-like domains protein 10 [Ruditapes philippinarum]|uniref:multiple epidermal growth factor-like domains protein 10 n=1 Tax=Ruditapes philippinarum TaxID=129788 RepID=UPI00295A5A16|nr:multiple epidermal growth factor-like domains protein 10 [Ruditapes philippinarum]XP_060576871.1 multiple epidermal growth factor-like domains protein 10 [Ruditapes philippinarum]XP_060576872.1 multiple epidermal growth factor-like domains protein 10 [Ruditapes philippinarum]